MAREFSEYRFDDLTTPIASYDPTKINLGFCMKKGTDSYNRDYISPLENKFFRILETYGEYAMTNASFEYDANTVWLFHTDGNSVGVRKIYMHIYNKLTDVMTFQGTISSTVYGGNNLIYSLNVSLEKHTVGTVGVSGTTVTGTSTTWKTDGACVGNRIGFGSTDPALITTWYQISSLTNDGQIILTESAGTITAGTPYVIEDFRLIYTNYSNTTSTSGLIIIKGLRLEIFTLSSTTIPLSTTIDNLRATYRLASVTSSPVRYSSSTIMNKVSNVEQYAYIMTEPGLTTITIHKFNIRGALTVSAGSSTNMFILATGAQAHSGTSIQGFNILCRAIYGGIENIFFATQTRICRIIPSNITSGSTTFISDSMVELPPGGTSTFALTSALRSMIWIPSIDKFLVAGNFNGTLNRLFVFSYSPGGNFERAFSTIDTLQTSTYASFDIDTYTLDQTPGAAQYIDMTHAGGITMFTKYTVGSVNSMVYTSALSSDALYENSSTSYIITPEISTSSAVSLGSLRIDSERTRNANYTLYPREYYLIYFRRSGISDNSGSWSILNEAGDLSTTAPGSSIQFKIVFRTIGISTVADKIYGIILSYDTNNDPPSTTFYEPSVSFSDKSIGKVAWRQRALWETTNIPDLRIKMYDTSTVTLILIDTTSSPTEGVWEYSTNSGATWNAWSVSANAIGNYIRYTPNSAIGLGVNVKIKLYKI